MFLCVYVCVVRAMGKGKEKKAEECESSANVDWPAPRNQAPLSRFERLLPSPLYWPNKRTSTVSVGATLNAAAMRRCACPEACPPM